MPIKKAILYGVLAVGILCLATCTTYFSLHHFMMPKHTRLEEPVGTATAHDLIHAIGWNAEQQNQLEPLEKTLHLSSSHIQTELAEERMALCRLLRADSLDQKAIEQSVGNLGRLYTEQERLAVQHLVVMRGLMRPDQKEKFFDGLIRGICEKCRAGTGSHSH